MRPSKAPIARCQRFPAMELRQIIQIDQHQHEEQQHQDRAGVDDDLDHRQVLGAEHNEHPRDLHKADHQEDRGV